MSSIELMPTRCAICGTTGNAREVYPARLPAGAFEPRVFSARRAPDGIHYRMVRCSGCGLVRSDPAATAEALSHVYAESGFDYASEVANLGRTYGRELDRLGKFGVRKDSLLEIGCGNGFLLEEASRRGFRDVRGIEPSEEAVRRSPESIRPRIVRGTVGPGAFAKESFDVICLFQVLDHLPDP
ncbi:MAG: methyltransferase domain-containing protein, partial [Acidobacteriota bacterium]